MCPPSKTSILKHELSSGNKKDLPVNSEIRHVLVGDMEGDDDGSILGALVGSMLGVLLGFSDGLLLCSLLGVELGDTDGNEDGDGVGQVWKVNVSPYDPKIGILDFSVILASISLVGRVGSSNKSNSPSYPKFGLISYTAKLPVDLEVLNTLWGVALNKLLVQSVLEEVSL
jgi:hypothetical protein